MLDLTTEGVNASTTDIDDRRYVFQIIAIHLQNQQQVAHKLVYFCTSEYVVTMYIQSFVFSSRKC